jgi:hypothetical protein
MEQRKYEFRKDKYCGENILIMNVIELLPVFFIFLYWFWWISVQYFQLCFNQMILCYVVL